MKSIILAAILSLFTLVPASFAAETCDDLETVKTKIEEVDKQANVGPEAYTVVDDKELSQGVLQIIAAIAGPAPFDTTGVDKLLLSKTTQEGQAFITFFANDCRIGGSHIVNEVYVQFIEALGASGVDVSVAKAQIATGRSGQDI